MKAFFVYCALFIGLHSAHQVYAKDDAACTEEQKIEFLIKAVAELNGSFVRNGKEYEAKAAAEHLRLKLKRARSSIFAPAHEKWTAALFIEKLASKSSSSGQDYRIVVKGQPTISAKDWLSKKVGDCRAPT